MSILKAAIASPHWEACYTCKHHDITGCKLINIDLHLYCGDWILCDEYEEKE